MAQLTQLGFLAIYAAVVVSLAALALLASYLLGEKHYSPSPPSPYEAGLTPTGTTHLRYPVQFYLVALSFLIFDLESAFVFAWAIAARDSGPAGYLGLAAFIAILMLMLIYEVKSGVFAYHSSPRRGTFQGGRP